MQLLPQAFIMALAMCGVLSVIAIPCRPALFRPALAVFSILGAGPMIEGHAIIDEFLLSCGKSPAVGAVVER